MEITERLEAAIEVARQAGAMILRMRPNQVTGKGPKDYVTEIDVRSEKLIRKNLLSRFPSDAFYGEEGGRTGSSRYEWIVDPIDGTTNYIKNIPLYTVSIGLSVDGEWTAGCVYAPALDEMFSGRLGGGAYLNGQPIHVSAEETLSQAVVGFSFAHRSAQGNQRMLRLLPELTSSVNDLRRMGSAAFDLCCVACGRLDAFLELKLYPYDIAAGSVIAREAGAIVTGWDQDDDYRKTGNILAASPALHADLKNALRNNP